jgi:hypothetical protein
MFGRFFFPRSTGDGMRVPGHAITAIPVSGASHGKREFAAKSGNLTFVIVVVMVNNAIFRQPQNRPDYQST